MNHTIESWEVMVAPHKIPDHLIRLSPIGVPTERHYDAPHNFFASPTHQWGGTGGRGRQVVVRGSSGGANKREQGQSVKIWLKFSLSSQKLSNFKCGLHYACVPAVPLDGASLPG